jgi:demethylmenaquinone methyltransferase/2-methoxy-6-polyprenyl-1,4-benzoquinol methylase
MFAGDLRRSYDRLNHLLSLNIDKRWRRFTVDQLKDVLQRPIALALDLCCGTADLTLELAPTRPRRRLRFLPSDVGHRP